MNDLEFKRQVLDPKGTFCAAKWYNATIWLGSGITTSCHHPPAHKINNELIKNTITNSGNKYLFSIPYTPKTNPIEGFFNQLKYY